MSLLVKISEKLYFSALCIFWFWAIHDVVQIILFRSLIQSMVHSLKKLYVSKDFQQMRENE